MGKALAVAAALFGVVLVVAAFVVGGVAIWTHGPDAARWQNTALMLGFPGFFFAIIGGAVASEL